MAARADLIRQLATLGDDLGPIVAPADSRAQLIALCRTVRLAAAAAAVSIARLEPDALVYEAADGEGSDAIIGTRLLLTQGIASYVARTGQSLVVDRVGSDARFARDIAEHSGYVPDSMVIAPIVHPSDDRLVGVISVLDRSSPHADALAVASSAAEVAAPILLAIDSVMRLGPMLVRAIADAVAAADPTLAPALRRLAARLPEPDNDLAAIAALLADVRALPRSARQSVDAVLRELLHLSATRKRR